MANGYSVQINEIVSDGTNYFVKFEIRNRVHTLPPITVIFPASTPASTINTYMQNIADAAPIAPADIRLLTTKLYV